MSRIKWLLWLLPLFFPVLACGQGCTNTAYGVNWTCVQSVKGNNNGGDVVITLGSAVAAGSFLIIEGQSCLGSVGGCDLNVNTPIASDNVNGSWGTCGVFFQEFIPPGPSIQTFICGFCGSAAGSVTATAAYSPNTGNRNFHVAFLQEWKSAAGNCNSGAGGGFNVGGNNCVHSASPPWPVTLSSATSNTNELIVAVIAITGANASSVDAPFQTVDSDTTFHDFVAAREGPTLSTYTAQWQGGGAAQICAVIGAWRISGATTGKRFKGRVIHWNWGRKIPFDRNRRVILT